MFPPADNSGVWAGITGLVLLVMIAISVSVMIDYGVTSVHSADKITQKIEQENEYKNQLQRQLERAKLQWNLIKTESDSQTLALANDRSALKKLIDKHSELARHKAMISRRNSQLEAEINTYLQALRAQQISQLVGQQFDQFETRTGRVFHDITIREVTEYSFQISHSNGLVKLPMKDLTDSWQNRILKIFQPPDLKAKSER